MKIFKLCFAICICTWFLSAASAESSYPVLYMKQGDVDAKSLITKLAPTGTDIDAVLSNKEIFHDYGDDIDGIRAHRDIYFMDGITICIDEPSGNIRIDWDSELRNEFERIEQEQHAKYDPNYTGYMADGTTKLISTTDYAYYGEDGFDHRWVDEFVHSLSEILGYELSLNPEWGYTYIEAYPDGQRLNKGVAYYAIVRNTLPVETQGLWSEISVNGYYIEGESLQVIWYGDTIVRVYLSVYQLVEEKELTAVLLSEEEARVVISREIQKQSSASGELIADLCYMPTFDPQGERYAIFVPAWRFRYGPLDSTLHRINAYTGEIIR